MGSIGKSTTSAPSISETSLANWMEDEGLQFTTNVNSAIYLLPDGRMISGVSIWNPTKNRDIDHRTVESLINKSRYDKDFWKDVFKDTHFVMVIPENKQIMISNDVALSNNQLTAINKLKGWDILS